MESHKFRRPAALTPKEAEDIIGDIDPADEAEVAHTSAWALMGVPNADFDATDTERLRTAVRARGVDIVADLWARSPDFTLAGALWRLYLLWQWHQADPDVLMERYDEGLAALEQEGRDLSKLPTLEETIRAVGGVLAGYATEDDLPPVLDASATVMRIMAAGVTSGAEWIGDDDHHLAHPVTRRPEALLATAAELEESAQQARIGNLD